jgi:putative FmdB family regulatory protein
MPTYEYICSKCGHEFDIFQRMTDSLLKDCPHCGKMALKRKIGTGAGIIFKGNGFYCTDYRKESYTKGAEKDKNVESSAKSESKSAAAASTAPASSSKD